MESTHITQPSIPPVRSGRVRLGLIVAVIVLAALFLLGTLPRLQNRKHLEAMAQETNSNVTEVIVTSPTQAPTGDLLLPGNITAIEDTTINARTGGYLRKRYVDIGSRVKAGQVLAEIEAPEVDQQVTQAQADTAHSQAGADQARADVARLQAGVAQARSETVRLQANVEASRAELARSQAKLAQSVAAEANARAKLAQSRQALEGRKADLNQATAHVSIAEKTWQRWQQLARQGAVSQQELDEKRSTYDAETAAVSGARSAINSAEADVAAAQETVNAAQADIAAAQADVNASKQNVAAAQAAVRSNESTVLAAEASVTASRSNVLASQASIRSSLASQQRYSVLRSFERVVAPFDGVITARNVDTGALINATTTSPADTGTTPKTGLFGIARTDVLRIQVQVPQSFINTVRPGQTAQILLREFPGHPFTGTVFQSSGALDSATRTLLTEIHIPNPDNILRPGMYAQVQFHDPQAHSTLHIASNTLVINADGTRVAEVTAENRVHFVPVTIGRDFGTEAEITQGLQGKELLITNPTDDLREGMAVHATILKKPATGAP